MGRTQKDGRTVRTLPGGIRVSVWERFQLGCPCSCRQAPPLEPTPGCGSHLPTHPLWVLCRLRWREFLPGPHARVVCRLERVKSRLRRLFSTGQAWSNTNSVDEVRSNLLFLWDALIFFTNRQGQASGYGRITWICPLSFWGNYFHVVAVANSMEFQAHRVPNERYEYDLSTDTSKSCS